MYVAWFKENIANKQSDSQQVTTSGPEHTPFSPPTPQMSCLLGPSICIVQRLRTGKPHVSKVTLIWWLKDIIKFLPHTLIKHARMLRRSVWEVRFISPPLDSKLALTHTLTNRMWRQWLDNFQGWSSKICVFYLTLPGMLLRNQPPLKKYN